jgi:crotonobetainyl-CoA:carnitine CoA-transferase CaiB-like acyl-CoA transferase
MSGQAVRFGYRHEEARVSRIYFPDPVAGTHALVALLAALRRRTDTGLGCEIDLSQQETMWMQLGEGIVYRSMTGREPARMENGEPGCVPSGMFPCLDDRWIALVVSSDTQFGALVRATHGQLAEFVGHDRALRVANRVPIERALRSFTAGQARDRILENFRREGVPSAPANGFAEAVDAVRLSRNQWYEDVDHPEARVRTYLRLVQRLDGAPLTTQRPAPCFGEHTREVLLELAGLDDVAIDRLYERGVLATEPEFA